MITLTAADGVTLEAELSVPEDAWAGAVLLHPHPLYGGDMHTVLPATLFERLPPNGIAAMRFNFRGVGRSTGEHGGGVAEHLDVVAAIEALPAGLPVLLAGWSFGADVALDVLHERVAGWFAVAPPLRVLRPSPAPMAGRPDLAAAGDERPKLLLVPEHDQYRLPDSARDITAAWTNTTVEVLPGTDHFLAGAATRLAERFLTYASDTRSSRSSDQ